MTDKTKGTIIMKLKSLIAVVLLAFAGSAMAQRDITNQYITNATLSNGTSGWTVSNFNTPAQGNNTVGYATEAYAGWGNLDVTNYSLTQNITLPAGRYRLVNYSFFRQGLRYNSDPSKSLAYLKAGSQQEAIKTLGSITGIPTSGDNGGYANSQAEGANCFDSKMYRNVVEFDIASDNTTIQIGIVGTFDLKQSWCIVGMFELFDMNDLASVSSPTDVTYLITNPGFEYRNATGWTSNNGGVHADNNNFGHKAGTGFVERWQYSGNGGLSNGSFTQTLTGLENGLYELTVYAQNREQYNNDADGRGMYVKANDDRTQITSSGQHRVRTNVTNGNLTIGIQLDGCTGNWIAFDRFALAFYGDPDAALRDLLAGYIDEAEALLNSDDAPLLSAAQTAALQQAIDDAKSATSANLSTQVDNLSAAIDTARQQIQTVKTNREQMLAALERFENDYNLQDGTDYGRVTMSAEAWASLLGKVNAVSTALGDASLAQEYASRKDALIAQMNATDASLLLFKRYKAMAEGTVSVLGGSAVELAPTSDTDTDATETAAIARLNTAFTAYANSQTSAIDMGNFLGENLDFDAAAGSDILVDNNGNTIKNVTGWEVAYADADTWAVLQTDQNENPGKLYMRKNWGSAATTLTVTKQCMLPVGKYVLTFDWNSNMANMTNRSQYKVGETATTIGENTNSTLSYVFEVTESAQPFDLTFGFQKQNTGNSPAQLIVDNVTLKTLVPATPNNIIFANGGSVSNVSNVVMNGTCANLVITDKVDMQTTREFEATAATYVRTMAAATQYGTLLLPFPIDVAQSDVDFYTLRTISTDDEGAMTFTQVVEATIPAGTPLLFKKQTADATTVTIRGSGLVPVVSGPISVQQGEDGWTALGLYQHNSALSGVNTYYIASDQFWYADGSDLNMYPFRTVFVSPTGTDGKARSLIISIDDGDATHIANLRDGTELQGDIYTVSGQLVRPGAQSLSNLPRGIYIVGGKKVVLP